MTEIFDVMQELTEAEATAFGQWCIEQIGKAIDEMPARGELVAPPPQPQLDAETLRADIARWREEAGREGDE